MNVQSLIKGKGNKVETIATKATIADGARRLSELGIGALVVSEDGQTIAGILSERDIVRLIGREGPLALNRRVSEVMTATVVTCTTAHTIEEVMGFMTRGKFRHMPVVQDGKLAGIISIGDVVKHRMSEIESEAAELRRYIAS